jgi:hypothetical protein
MKTLKLVLAATASCAVISSTTAFQRNFVKGLKNTYKITYQSDALTDSGLSIEEGTLVEEVASTDGQVKLEYQYTVNKLEYLTEPKEMPVEIDKDKITLKHDIIQEIYIGSTPLHYFVNIPYEAFKGYFTSIGKNSIEGATKASVNTLDYYDIRIVPKTKTDTANIGRYQCICFTNEGSNNDSDGTRHHIPWTTKARSTGFILGSFASDARRNGCLVIDNDGFIKKAVYNLPNLVPSMPLTALIKLDLEQKKRGTEEFPVKLIIERIGCEKPERVTNQTKRVKKKRKDLVSSSSNIAKEDSDEEDVSEQSQDTSSKLTKSKTDNSNSNMPGKQSGKQQEKNKVDKPVNQDTSNSGQQTEQEPAESSNSVAASTDQGKDAGSNTTGNKTQ